LSDYISPDQFEIDENVGTVVEGKYAGYHIVVSMADVGGPVGDIFLFVTNDFKHFIVDNATTTTNSYTVSDLFAKNDSPDDIRFGPSVVAADEISFQIPPPILEVGDFILARSVSQMVFFYPPAYLARADQLPSNKPNLWFYEGRNAWNHETIYAETQEGLSLEGYMLFPREREEQVRSGQLEIPFYVASDFVDASSTYGEYSEFFTLDSAPKEDLVPVTQTRSGTRLYSYKDLDAQGNQESYDNKILYPIRAGAVSTSTFYRIEGGSKVLTPVPTFEQYVARHPVLFFKDPWARWTEVNVMDYPSVPSEGKGKPVIYLYPTHTEQVNVKVDPVGGFTKTEPVYGVDGWNVLATPESVLTNLTDDETYPYLFWEGGAKGIVDTPKEGFVVAKADVQALLRSKLALLGLTARESADFMNFWVPRLSRAPYYFITFVPKSEMDRVAPLTITPKPDTVIRVLMDYIPLQVPIIVPPLSIHTPSRVGFTAVEWGGILRD